MIVVIGEALIDMIQSQSEPEKFTAVPGGANANVAFALARREHPHQFLGRISNDLFGKQIRKHLADNGVSLDLAISANEQSTLAFASIDDQGVADYSFYVEQTADWMWQAHELPTVEAIQDLEGRAIQYGCLTMAMTPGNRVIEKWLSGIFDSDALTLSHDVNVRPALGHNRDSERERVEKLNRISTIIKASDADIQWLYPDRDLEEIAQEWLGGLAKLVIITKGSEGAIIFRGQDQLDVQGLTIDLEDTVGAGDTFMANFLVEMDNLEGLGDQPLKRIERLDIEDIERAARIAVTASAIACERAGAQPPTLREIEQKLGQ
ncbi:MAG: carbohydrate kinase [Microbacteriaceae bacterium]|nr:carbohydrate kinase [Microbacteriaceae bacterium]